MSAENGKLKIGVRAILVKPCSMSQALIHPANGASEFSPCDRARPGQRKRSSSLFALDELPQDPSPPLSPSVSITFNRDSNTSGEIPIIFDFLTTSSMPSVERVSKMASLKPALPPLVKFSPMSAFFPMSDSTGSFNTISTEAFSTKRLVSCSSGASHGRLSLLSDCSAVYSTLSADFHSKLPSPTESVEHETRDYPQESIVSSSSAPVVHVLNYDIGQKELADISDFTISAYLPSPARGDVSNHLEDFLQLSGVADGRGSQDDSTAQPILSEIESENRILLAGRSGDANANNLLSTSGTPDLDDKTPTQSTFRKRRTEDYFGDAVHFTSSGAEASRASKAVSELSSSAEPPSTRGGSLTIPSSPDSDDKTPTQATFLKQHTGPSLPGSMPKTVRGAASSYESNSRVPESPDYDDTTPTQTTFLQRCKHPDALPPAGSPHAVEQADTAETSSKRTSPQTDVDSRRPSRAESRDRDLPAGQPIDETEEFTLIKSPAPSGSLAFHTVGPRSALPVPCLRHAQWLRDTIVELWIDQEGFRAIRPKFFLASVSNGLPYSCDPSGQDILELSEEHDPLYTTVAEFLPVSRVASYFHRAAFDRGPTLHRITTGDETKDYITRTATISLRDNGVFFVQGTEDHRIDADSHGNGGRIIRLNWRFEYFVSSRRPDGRSSQKGEKMITPLSFSCTPALLHPKRAHKVTVFHIMKKTVLPNLVAQKLEPPDLPMIETHPSAASLISLTSLMSTMAQSTMSIESRGFVKVCSPQKASKPLVGKADTRNQRGSVFGAVPAPDRNARLSAKKQKHPFSPTRLESPPRPPLKQSKHRRGSYSDITPEDYLRQQHESPSRRNLGHMTHERSRSASLVQQGCGHKGAAGTNDRPKSSGNTKSNPLRTSMITGPIIPQQELMKMLDRDRYPSTNQAPSKPVERRPHSIRVDIVNDMPVTTLPAPPRQRHNQ